MIIYQKKILRSDLKLNPGVLYAFGDNLDRVGLGGQAKEMRGEPNAVGLATKKSTYLCYTDTAGDFSMFLEGFSSDLALLAELGSFDIKNGWKKTVVFPTDGVGTGLACLPPRFLEKATTLLAMYGIENGKR